MKEKDYSEMMRDKLLNQTYYSDNTNNEIIEEKDYSDVKTPIKYFLLGFVISNLIIGLYVLTN